MSRNSYGTFLDSLNAGKTELRSIGEATGADEVSLNRVNYVSGLVR